MNQPQAHHPAKRERGGLSVAGISEAIVGKRLDPALQREHILAAAERLFTGRRFHEVTTDDIAREAHVSKGTLYRHFKDKDDLLFHAMTAGLDELCYELTHLSIDKRDPTATLLEACESIAAFFARRRSVMHMIQAEESRAMLAKGKAMKRWKEQRGQLVAALAHVISQAQQTNAIRNDLPSSTLASLLLGLMRSRMRDAREDGEPQLSIAQVVELFLNGAANGK